MGARGPVLLSHALDSALEVGLWVGSLLLRV